MTHIISLPDKIDTAAAPALLDQIRLARGRAVTLDASGTHALGAACAQILLAARVAWADAGERLRLVGTAGIAADLSLLGLAGLFDETDGAA